VDTSLATSVRRAQPSDTAPLTELVNRAYSIESTFIEGDRTNAGEIAALIETGALWVLEHAGGICAAVLSQGPGQRAGVPPAHGYLGMLSVLPEMQGQGLGRRLVRIVEDMAAAAGATAMFLRIINLREELGRWYQSMGYLEVGTAPYKHRPVKRPCHFIEMAKPLTAGPRDAAG
jgi:ribosomal protein S18 acetylase RimI-like enzyme